MTLHVPNLTTDTPADPQGLSVSTADVQQGPYRIFFKRAIDLTLVLLSLPLVLPLILFLALAIALTGNMPFYTQLRVGKGGDAFRMWKLRTMVGNADRVLEEYLERNPAARREWDSNQKLRDDPRITRFGRLLRKTSIDELPQLFNVLNGSMSLVGPRPMMVGQEKDYHGSAYYDMRPGITGLWQVSGRNDCAFHERAGYDNIYFYEMSLKTDFRTLLQTVGVVCKATGH